ncbi:MAG: type IV pilus modification protein PilV [Pseudomonadota bacterium]
MIRTPQSIRGVGLIEILVTVLVMSIGLLGAGALLSSSLRVSQSSLDRTHAGTLASEILDRMRTNPNAARTGSYNVAIGAAGGGGGQIGADLQAWKNRLALELPTGDGGVACTGNPIVCTVTIQWDDQRAGGSGTEQFVVVSRP